DEHSHNLFAVGNIALTAKCFDPCAGRVPHSVDQQLTVLSRHLPLTHHFFPRNNRGCVLSLLCLRIEQPESPSGKLLSIYYTFFRPSRQCRSLPGLAFSLQIHHAFFY